MTTVVQQANSTAVTGTSVSVTLPAAPTPGNLLVAVLGGQGTNGVTTSPWGATQEQNAVAASTSNVRFYSKVAGTGESATVSATFPVSGLAQIWVIEVAPTAGKVWDSTRLDQGASTPDSGSNVSTISSGTTAALAATDDVAIAAVVLQNLSGGSVTVTNGYTLDLTGSRILVGHKILTSSAATSTTFSWTTARPAASAIQTYRQVAGGAPTDLTVHNARAVTRASNPLLTQASALAVHGARAVARADSPVLAQASPLTVHNARAETRTGSPLLTVPGPAGLIVHPVRAETRAGSPTLAQSTDLTISGARSETRADSPVVAQVVLLTLHDSRAQTRADAAQLDQLALLTIHGARAPTRAGTPTLFVTASPTPAARTYTIPAENRTYVITP